MIDVSRGLLGIYGGVKDVHKGPNVIIADFPLSGQFVVWKVIDEGINAVITQQKVIPSHIMDPKIKNRVDYII